MARKRLQRMIINSDRSDILGNRHQVGAASNAYFQPVCYNPLSRFSQSGKYEEALLGRGPCGQKEWSASTMVEVLLKGG